MRAERSTGSSIPGPGLRASARAVGRFYEFLCSRMVAGHWGVGRPLDEDAVRHMTRRQRPSFSEETPLIDFGSGLTLEARRHGDQYAYFGSHCGLRTFGHLGHGSPMAYADPEHQLVVSFNGNGLPGRVVGRLIWRRISDAVYTELGLASSSRPSAHTTRPVRERFIDLRPPTLRG